MRQINQLDCEAKEWKDPKDLAKECLRVLVESYIDTVELRQTFVHVMNKYNINSHEAIASVAYENGITSFDVSLGKFLINLNVMIETDKIRLLFWLMSYECWNPDGNIIYIHAIMFMYDNNIMPDKWKEIIDAILEKREQYDGGYDQNAQDLTNWIDKITSQMDE